MPQYEVHMGFWNSTRHGMQYATKQAICQVEADSEAQAIQKALNTGVAVEARRLQRKEKQ